MIKSNHGKNWFTIVELIVVITILAILWTIWFISYVWHISTTRDSTRLSQVQIINQALEWYTKWRLPLPDSKVTIYANWAVIWYQWYVWENVLSDIWVNEWGKDPLDESYYTYFIDNKQKYTQLLTFLENQEEGEVSYNWIITQANAADYTERFPRPYWAKLWILVESGSNTPIQELSTIQSSWLDIVTTTTGPYTAYISQDKTISWTWLALQSLQQSIAYGWVWFGAPRSCPEGFIKVPWNAEFNQPGFCVMKYEATYEDAIIPVNSSQWVVNFQAGKVPVSKPWLFPIWNLTQLEAITACKSIWEWYHLITNNEWMTLARNIESVWSNWSWNSVWSWWIFIWLNHIVNTLWCSAENSLWRYQTTWTTMAATLSSDTTKWWSNKWSDCDSKRQHILSNWEIIWDISGNVRENVNWANTLDWSNNATMLWTTCNWVVSWNSTEFSTCSFVSPYSYANQWPKLPNLSSIKWIWIIYSYSLTSRVFLRWNSDNNDWNWVWWIYTLVAWWDNSTENNIAGFRCAK